MFVQSEEFVEEHTGRDTESGGTGTTALNQEQAVAAMLKKYEVCLNFL